MPSTFRPDAIPGGVPAELVSRYDWTPERLAAFTIAAANDRRPSRILPPSTSSGDGLKDGRAWASYLSKSTMRALTRIMSGSELLLPDASTMADALQLVMRKTAFKGSKHATGPRKVAENATAFAFRTWVPDYAVKQLAAERVTR